MLKICDNGNLFYMKIKQKSDNVCLAQNSSLDIKLLTRGLASPAQSLCILA